MEEVGVIGLLPGAVPETKCEGRMPRCELLKVSVESGLVGGENVRVLATGDATLAVVSGGVKGHCEFAGGVMLFCSSKSARAASAAACAALH